MKMFPIQLILFVLLQSNCAYSQISSADLSKIDSLQKVLQNEKNDTNKVNTLNKLSRMFCVPGKYDTALKIASQSLGLAQKLRFRTGEANSLSCSGYACVLNGKFDVALKFFLGALNIYQEMDSNREVENIYQDLVYTYNARGFYDQALGIQYEALKYSEKKGDKNFEAEMLSEIGNEYEIEGNDSNALEKYQAAVDLGRTINDSDEIIVNLSSVGEIYGKIGRFQDALQAASEATKICESRGSREDSLIILSCREGFGNIYEKLGERYSLLGQQRESEQDYRMALDKYMSILNDKKAPKNDIAFLEITKNEIGLLLIKLKRYSEARKYFQQNQEFLKKVPIARELKNYHQGLATIDSAEGKYKAALGHYEEYISYRDSLDNEKTTKKSLQASIQYEFDKKELLAKVEQDKKDAEQNRIKNQQYFIIAGLVVFVLSVLIIALIQFRNNKQKKKANIILGNTLTDLKSTQTQLIQQEKMASLGELTAGIAHEIQNPLNFVNNFSEVSAELIDELKEGLIKGDMELAKFTADDIKQNLERINHHGRRADAIVKGMLQHSNKSSGQKEQIDINKLAQEYLRLAYHGFKTKEKDFTVKIETDFDEYMGKLELVPQDIGRVFHNLYNNAFYAINEKKKNAEASYEPEINISTKQTANQVVIMISDNAAGIPKNIVDKIFQPFFTTKPTGQGTGLGLSLSYDIIKAHGGTIKVETEANAGTKFIIILPTEIKH